MSRKKPAKFSLSNQDRDIFVDVLKTLFACDEQITELLDNSKLKVIWDFYNRRKDFTYFSKFIGNKIIISFSNIPLNYVKDNINTEDELNNVLDTKKEEDKKIVPRTRGKGKKGSKKVFSFALDDKTFQLLDSHADNEDRSFSSVVRLALYDYINKHGLEENGEKLEAG